MMSSATHWNSTLRSREIRRAALVRTLPLRALSLAVLLVLPWAGLARADGAGNADTVVNGCMQDLYDEFGQGGGLKCTANDVQVANAFNIVITDDGCAFPGDTVTFDATFEVLLTAQGRHDVGLYFATDGDTNGDGALTGTCSLSTPPYDASVEGLFTDLDMAGDDTAPSDAFGYCADGGGFELDADGFPKPCNEDADCSAGFTCQEFSGIQDTCGDIDDAPNPIFVNVTGITAACIDTDGDGQLDLPNCTSWRQPGANDLCLSPKAAFPGAPSKCRCDIGFGVPIRVPAFITIDKVTVDFNGEPLPGDPTLFDFSITGPDADLPDEFQLDDDDVPHDSPPLDTTDEDGSSVGPYQVTETAPQDWALLSASCTSDNGTPNDPNDDFTFAYTNGSDIHLVPGEVLICTFTNELVFVPDPAIDLIKTGQFSDEDGDGFADAGETISYTYIVQNAGNVDLSNVFVDDPLPGLSLIDCPQTTLATDPDGEEPFEGESMTCTGSYPVTQADIDAGMVDNTAEAFGTDPDGTEVSDPDSHTEPLNQGAAIEIVKDGSFQDENGDGNADVGETISYTLDVTNTGNVTLSNVDVTDPLVTVDCGMFDGELSPGESVSCTGSYPVTQADIDAGTRANLATTTGDCPDGTEDCASDDDPHDEPLPQAPAIDIEKTPDFQLVDEGTLAIFTITVTNTGNVTLDPVTVSDPLAPDCDRDLGSMAPGDVQQYDCSVMVTANLTNVATATGTPPAGGRVSDVDDADVVMMGDVCEDGKPQTLVMLYTGTPCVDFVTKPGMLCNQQSGPEIIMEGDAMMLDPARIVVMDHRGKVLFDGLVELNGTFSITGPGNKRIPPRTRIEIYDPETGELKETIQFHSSCSQPLFTGDDFGSVKLIDEG